MVLSSARMRAMVVNRAVPGGLAIHEVDRPNPASHQALVRVAATSLDHGDVEREPNASMRTPGTLRLGTDLAGTIEAAAADGTGPRPGTRVVGLVRAGAWAELVAVPTNALAAIPTALSFALAAALPAAGLTALHALAPGGLLAGKKVLVSGATDGVGLFAVQIAHASGAQTTGAVRFREHDAIVEEYGADHVVTGGAGSAAEFGPYHFMLTDAEDPALAAAPHLMRPGGTCVMHGGPGARGVKVHQRAVFAERHVRLRGFELFKALRSEPASEGLERLLALVEQRTIRPHVEVEASWTDVAAVARRVLGWNFVGKAVLHL